MPIPRRPSLVFALEANRRTLALRLPHWRGFCLRGLRPRVTLDGCSHSMQLRRAARPGADTWELRWRTPGLAVELHQQIVRESPCRVRIVSTLVSGESRSCVFNSLDIGATDRRSGGLFLGRREPGKVRMFEQTVYDAQVRSIGQILSGSDGRLGFNGKRRSLHSTALALLHHPSLPASLLIGFETSDRFRGSVLAEAGTDAGKAAGVFDNVDTARASGQVLLYPSAPVTVADPVFPVFRIHVNGSDIPLKTGQSVRLETVVLETGTDPYRLLNDHARRIAAAYRITDLPEPFANWCSWYPHRLALTEDHMLQTARVALQHHLDKLGLRFIQADLGWEKDNLPTCFEENERFPHGLAWLARRLESSGFELGVWKGFACISEKHPIARQHRDWLVRRPDGKPLDTGRWFWEPHHRMFALDGTHPGARDWVRRSIESLARRGVRYLKWDFGGALCVAGQRHDPAVAFSGGYEGMRTMSRIVRDAMNVTGREGLVLDCTAQAYANLGHFKMWYVTNDTGNNGLGFAHLRRVYTTVAGHLFMNRVLALIQPSCVVVGPPGTLEEGRLRATVTFMTGGHVDLGDDLTALPEDRWPLITSMLPPPPASARPVDLYCPVRIQPVSYVALCKGEKEDIAGSDDPQGATVWHMPVTGTWDQWHLVAVTNYFDSRSPDGSPVPTQFDIPLRHLGLREGSPYWAHEFWAGCFLGRIPVPSTPAGAYRHPGDYARLVYDSNPDTLRVIFSGPAVRLLVIRRPRPHPWVVGTTFHQSGGLELDQVKWDARRRILSGILCRPPNEAGRVFVAGIRAGQRARARVAGRSVPVAYGANGSVSFPVTAIASRTPWSMAI